MTSEPTGAVIIYTKVAAKVWTKSVDCVMATEIASDDEESGRDEWEE